VSEAQRAVVEVDPVEVGNVVAGELRMDGDVVEVSNPGRLDEPAGTYRSATPLLVDEAARAARAAQRRWSALTPRDRVPVLETIAARIEANADQLGRILAAEAGIPVAQAIAEAIGAAGAFRNSAEMLVDVTGTDEIEVATGGRIRVGRRPIGLVACIVPWNAPLGLAAQKLAPAIATGNGVLLKPSPLAPLAVTTLATVVAGELPAGLVNIVNGGGDVGAALIDHPLVRKVSFTGGGATARAIMSSAAQTLKKVHFELGGNDPAIVLDDADLGLSAQRIVASAFRRAGQICYAVKRVYVPETRYAAFAERLEHEIAAVAVGDSFDPRTTMGPLSSRAQLDFVAGLADRARESGREVRVGGVALDAEGWNNGHFLKPAWVPDAAPDDELVGTEQFGPLLPVVRYRTIDEVIDLANDSEYGLGSSIWTSDPERALSVAERIESGVTFVNNHVLSRAGFRHIPFGGLKQSGMGWENSPAGLEEYLEFHSIDIHPIDSNQEGRR